jgi:glycerophosphoryl diester phosphodiesterase
MQPKKLHLISISDLFDNNKTIVESHRGINREIFENTLESFARAINYGIDSIETDVWLSKDNVLVIYHGWGEFGQLQNLYDHSGNIIETNWKDLSYYKTLADGLNMPTLKDVMELTKDKIFLNLEIKDPRVNLIWPFLVELIEKYKYYDQIALSSFFFDYYNKTKEYNRKFNRNIPFGFLYHRNNSQEFIVDKTGNCLNVYWTDATKSLCDRAHKNGMAVLVWFEMLDEENFSVYKWLIDNGVNVICSNEPMLAKKYVKEYYNKFYKKSYE